MFNALTAIDMVTNLVEIIHIDCKTSEHIINRFAQSWMARYPWPKHCVHDNGGEFVGWEFQQFLDKCNVKDVPTTSKKPSSKFNLRTNTSVYRKHTENSTTWRSS